MKQYISKDILMSQLNIELSNLRKAESDDYITEFGKGKLEGLEGIADFILNYCDIEVDLEYEIEKVKKMQKNFEIKNDTIIEFCAKHFYELGLKAKGE